MKEKADYFEWRDVFVILIMVYVFVILWSLVHGFMVAKQYCEKERADDMYYLGVVKEMTKKN